LDSRSFCRQRPVSITPYFIKRNILDVLVTLKSRPVQKVRSQFQSLTNERAQTLLRRVRKSITFVSVLGSVTGLMLPANAAAGCTQGSTPSYNDITSVAVRRCGVGPAIYRFVAGTNGVVWFDGRFNTPVKGVYQGRDGKTLFKALIAILKSSDFYSIRLAPSPVLYIDGPCETIEAMRCGVATAIGGLGVDMLPFEADVKDPRTAKFTALLNAMQAPIFAWPWHKETYEPSQPPPPGPSAAP
jgi:hypothetical protein